MKDAKKKMKEKREKDANRLKALRSGGNKDRPWGMEDWSIQDDSYSND